jgi:hypothetical protein
MTFLDELKRARLSPISIYQQFLLKNHSSSSDCVHVFFEGHGDFSFYTGFLRRFAPHPNCLHSYKCGNKANVYATYSKIMLASPKGKVLFFVDKDFSDILNENYPTAENIYVTDYYSIENYLVSEDMLVRIWEETFHFPNALMDVGSTREKFLQELERFYIFMLPISAWIICLRRRGLSLNLNNVRLARLLSINSDLTIEIRREMKFPGEFNYLEQMCGITTPSECWADFDLTVKELAKLNPKIYIRGKFELWFLVKFVERLLEVLQRAISDAGGNISVKTQINEDNAIEVLGPRLQIPPSLEKFLLQNIGVL